MWMSRRRSIVQNAKLKMEGKAPFGTDEYIGEPKYDGIRAKIVKDGSKVKVLSRYGNDITSEFPELASAARKQLRGSVEVDGEITMPGSRWAALISKLKSVKHPKAGKVQFHAFDIMKHRNKSVETQPLLERKKLLRDSLKRGTIIKNTPYVRHPLKKHYKKYLKQGHEGTVLKKATSPYRRGKRTIDWIKVRKEIPIDAKIVGMKETPKGKMSFKLVDKKGNSLGLASAAKLDQYQRKALIDLIRRGRKPEVEVKGRSITAKHKVRHPRITRVRLDLQ